MRMARESQVLDIIENVYSAALDGERWPTALTAADLLGGVDTTLEVHREAGARPLFFIAGILTNAARGRARGCTASGPDVTRTGGGSRRRDLNGAQPFEVADAKNRYAPPGGIGMPACRVRCAGELTDCAETSENLPYLGEVEHCFPLVKVNWHPLSSIILEGSSLFFAVSVVFANGVLRGAS